MEFAKFTLLSIKENEPIREREEEILLNLNHVVSIKPINIVMAEKVMRGYWIRLTNGKKYRAIRIPFYIEDTLIRGDNKNIFIEEEDLKHFNQKEVQ
ncbi:MAG: hypothetical protein ACO20H_02155 [Bacteriovoracaceae bacterium]